MWLSKPQINEYKNVWTYTSSPLFFLILWCLTPYNVFLTLYFSRPRRCHAVCLLSCFVQGCCSDFCLVLPQYFVWMRTFIYSVVQEKWNYFNSFCFKQALVKKSIQDSLILCFMELKESGIRTASGSAAFRTKTAERLIKHREIFISVNELMFLLQVIMCTFTQLMKWESKCLSTFLSLHAHWSYKVWCIL